MKPTKSRKNLICLFALTVFVPSALALSGNEVQLKASTAAKAEIGATGELDTTVPERLVFHSPGKPDVTMAYLQISEFSSNHEDAFHLGFFPAMFLGMVAPRPQIYTLSITYKDDTGHTQVATFEVSKSLPRLIEPVLYARARNACVRREYGACLAVAPDLHPRIPLPAPLAAPQPAPQAESAKP